MCLENNAPPPLGTTLAKGLETTSISIKSFCMKGKSSRT